MSTAIEFNAQPAPERPQPGDVILGPRPSGGVGLMTVAKVRNLKTTRKVTLVYSTEAFSSEVDAVWEKLIEDGKHKLLTVSVS